jgi:hypothetical protein
VLEAIETRYAAGPSWLACQAGDEPVAGAI